MAEIHGPVVLITSPHKWAGCLAVIQETRSWGANVCVVVPRIDDRPPDKMLTRLNTGEFRALGVVV